MIQSISVNLFNHSFHLVDHLVNTGLQVGIVVLYIVHKFGEAPKGVCFDGQEFFNAQRQDVLECEFKVFRTMIGHFRWRNHNFFVLFGTSLLLQLKVSVTLMLSRYCCCKKDEQHRRSQVIYALYVSASRVAHCPREQNSNEHRLHLLATEEFYLWLGAVYVDFDLFEV